MAIDDLGQFPSPTANTPSDTTPVPEPDTSTAIAPPEPVVPEELSDPFADISSPITPPSPVSPQFEETPEIIPNIASSTTTSQTAAPAPAPLADSQPVTPAPEPPVYQPAPASFTPEHAPEPEILATITPKGGSSFGSLLTIILLLVAGISIAGVVFLLSQSTQLKQQLKEITQTIDSQRTTLTPTPTQTVIEFPTPTLTPEISPEATGSSLPTITVTPVLPVSTPSGDIVTPLADVNKALKTAINHEPNAQLILIKTENATDVQNAVTKYFFRRDLTTKKYFYVAIAGNGQPEIVDKAIYVTPDNSIPSLNDLALGNKMGADLDVIYRETKLLCTSGLCQGASVKAQYIKSGDILIWQLTLVPSESTKSPLIIQFNAATKVVLYKSTGFTK